MRVPVVASDVGGLPDTLIDGKTGLLVAPKNPAALAGAVVSLLQDPARRQRMGANARAFVQEHFDIEKVHDLWPAIYETALARRSAMV